MSLKKLSKKQLHEQQMLENKKFRKNMFIFFSSLIIAVAIFYTFYFYWCEIKFIYQQSTLYGYEVSADQICMRGDELEQHESFKLIHNNLTFYVCSNGCKHKIKYHYEEFAFVPDALTGDTICKANSIIGLKDKGSPKVIYFKNRENFDKYYKKNVKKSYQDN
jgi:hypothetical protein